MSQRARSGDVLTGVAAVAAAAGLLFAKEAADRVDPPTLGLLQYLIATPIALGVGLHAWRGGECLPRGGRQWLGIALHAVLIASALLAEFAALRVAPATTVSFVGRVEVVITVALGALLLSERLLPVEIVGGALALAGIVVLRWEAPPELSRGAALALLGAALFAGGEVVAKRVVRDVPSRIFLAARSIVVLAAFAVARLAWGAWNVGDVGDVGDAGGVGDVGDAGGIGGAVAPALGDLAPSTWALAAGLAACGPLLARGFYLEALRRIPLSRAALIMQAQPVLIVAAALLAGVAPRPLELVGGGVVVAGTVLVVLGRPDPSRRVRT